MPRTTHGLGKSNLWRVWFSMRQRCRLKSHKAYAHYGGRGIKVCALWQDYTAFYQWAVEGRTQTLMQWSEELGINYFTVWSRIKRGWDAEKAILTPIAWKRG